MELIAQNGQGRSERALPGGHTELDGEKAAAALLIPHRGSRISLPVQKTQEVAYLTCNARQAGCQPLNKGVVARPTRNTKGNRMHDAACVIHSTEGNRMPAAEQ